MSTYLIVHLCAAEAAGLLKRSRCRWRHGWPCAACRRRYRRLPLIACEQPGGHSPHPHS